MEWQNLMISAAVSAVVGSLVSLLAVSQVTVRRARAERREAARLAVASAVEPMLDKLARYRFATTRESAERDSDNVSLGDLQDVQRVWRASHGLSGVRRWLVRRRLMVIYGTWMVEVARDYPTSAAGESAAFVAWFAAVLRRGEVDERSAPASSLMHKTYSAPPSLRGGRALRYHLVRLAKAR